MAGVGGGGVMDALEALEKWKHGHKARSVEISIDDGYGATCWHVQLTGRGPEGKGRQQVDAYEVSFFLHEPGSYPSGVVFVVPPGVDGDWPGLARTIHAAIERAEKLGL